MSQIFKLDRLEVPENMIAVLADLEELWPEEVKVVDYIEISCSTPRARLAVGILAGVIEPPAEDGEIVDHTILNEVTADNMEISSDEKVDAASVENPSTTDMQADNLVCEICGKAFEPKQANSRFCSKSCAQKFYNQRYQAKKQDYEGRTVVFDQERETQRLVSGVRTGRMSLRGRKL